MTARDEPSASCPLFRPPAPVPLKRRRDLLMVLQRFFLGRYSAIATVSENAYRMKSGRIRAPGAEFIFITQPTDVRRCLITEAEHFPKSALMSDMLSLLIGDSIFVSNGKTWRRQRQMMNPAFELARIKDVFDQMGAAVAGLEERLDRLAGSGPTAIDMEMTHVTADIIFRTIFTRPIERHEAALIFDEFVIFQELSYRNSITRIAGIPSFLRFGRRRAKKAAARIRGVLDAIIAERYERARRGDIDPHQDILAAFMAARDPDDGTPFDLRELCEQVAMLFLAGHETSASALSWSLYLIAKSPAIQERLYAEATAVVGDRALRFDDMKRLAFTRDVFREALRLYPPVAFIVRDATRAEKFRDKSVQPGAMIVPSPWIIQRHQRMWAHADRFDPDRFETPEGTESARCAYLPFSQGPRVCLGAAFAMQEATLILASLVRRYRFSAVEGREPEPVSRLTLRSENGIWLTIERR